MSGFPWPPIRSLVAASIVGLFVAYWLDPHTSALVALAVLYVLIVLTP